MGPQGVRHHQHDACVLSADEGPWRQRHYQRDRKFRAHSRPGIHLRRHRQCRTDCLHGIARQHQLARRHPRQRRRSGTDRNRPAGRTREQEGAGKARRPQALAGAVHLGSARRPHRRAGRDCFNGGVFGVAEIHLHQRRGDHSRCRRIVARRDHSETGRVLRCLF